MRTVAHASKRALADGSAILTGAFPMSSATFGDYSVSATNNLESDFDIFVAKIK